MDAQQTPKPVSHCRIDPPEWLRLAGEPPSSYYDRTGALIAFDQTARCRCGSAQRPTGISTVVKTIKVFGIRSARAVKIEMLKCHELSCRGNPHRYLIPDCGRYGIMVWSKMIAMEHALLQDYLSHLSRSETPIVAFVMSTRSNYTQTYATEKRFIKRDKIPFCSYDTFSRVS